MVWHHHEVVQLNFRSDIRRQTPFGFRDAPEIAQNNDPIGNVAK